MPCIEISLLRLGQGTGLGPPAACAGWVATRACICQAQGVKFPPPLVSLLTQAGRWLGWVSLPCIGGGQYLMRVLVFVGFLLAVELPKGLFPGSSFRLASSHFSLWGYLFHFNPLAF